LHSGGDRHHLRTILDRAGISIRAPRSYQNDIQKLAVYSLDTIKSLASFATISIGRNNSLKIDRPSTRALGAAVESNSILVTGEPGSGKSGALYDLAVALQNDNHDVVFIAADRVESSSLNSLKQELALDHSSVQPF
jgi:predicted ATP-dependent serine protease